MKPVIGITASLDGRHIMVTRHYSDWILAKGGIPLIIPYFSNMNDLDLFIHRLDGLLLTGGGDIDPSYFKEEPHPKLGPITPERDFNEIYLAKSMLKLNKPILAICRGCQVLNIAAGGDMYQDLSTQYHHNELIQHDQNAPTDHASHTVNVDKNSYLFKILQMVKCRTNSFHHQAVKEVAPLFRAVAHSRDGVIEAIEGEAYSYAIGVQWHPECMSESDEVSQRLFHSFILACTKS